MSKLGFNEKQLAKKKHLEEYYRSYFELTKYKLEKRREKKLTTFRKTHDEKEALAYEKVLISVDEEVLANKKVTFDKRLQRRLNRIDKTEKDENKRVWEVDFVRGFIIIGMLIDHFIGDFWMVTRPLGIANANDFFLTMHRFSVAYWNHPSRIAVRLLGVMLLLVVSGISARFSRKSWLHGLLILAFGGLMSLAFGIVSIITHDFTMNVVIGAITCIGLCLLIYSLVKLLFYKVLNIGEHFKWFALFFAIVILVMWGFVSYLNPDQTYDPEYMNFWFIYNNYAGCIRSISTPDALKDNLWKVLLGLNYFGSDWLAIFPYLGYMFLGGFIGETVYKNKESLLRFIPQKGERSWNAKFNHATRGVTFCGKKSMWYYLLHQPLFIVIIGLIALMMGLTLSL